MQLGGSGAAYRAVHPGDINNDFEETVLIFEQAPGTGGTQRREYRVLSFEFALTEDAVARRVHIDLAPAGKRALEEMNRLVNEGFEVRDLFRTDKASVLLERRL